MSDRWLLIRIFDVLIEKKTPNLIFTIIKGGITQLQPSSRLPTMHHGHSQ